MRILFTKLFLILFLNQTKASDECLNLTEINEQSFRNYIKPTLDNKVKGENGNIMIIGGTNYVTGGPYFAGIAALKAGADLVRVVTTEIAAPIIRTYSPDFIVHPLFHTEYIDELKIFINQIDVVVLGAGSNYVDDDSTIYQIIEACKEMKKPIIIDAYAIKTVARNLTVLVDYPWPVIFTANEHEADTIRNATNNNLNIFGNNISILIKGKQDDFYSNNPSLRWQIKDGGSGRRTAGQGDILAGIVGTFYSWALKSHLCDNSIQLKQSIAVYAAAKLTKLINFKAFSIHGRSMVTSDMIKQIHNAFEELFGK